MTENKEEGRDPEAQRAAEEWRRRFGREGHEGSYARHPETDGAAEVEKPARHS
jgi:hypothetical protein